MSFEITPAVHGQRVLFDFMDAGDVLELLGHVAVYLKRMGTGTPPLRPPTRKAQP